MCTHSVIADYGRYRIPRDQWTRPVWNEYQEILKQLESLDRKLDQADCEDPGKTKWMVDVERRLSEIENEKVSS